MAFQFGDDVMGRSILVQMWMTFDSYNVTIWYNCYDIHH